MKSIRDFISIISKKGLHSVGETVLCCEVAWGLFWMLRLNYSVEFWISRLIVDKLNISSLCGGCKGAVAIPDSTTQAGFDRFSDSKSAPFESV